jgi:hypothetical protein
METCYIRTFASLSVSIEFEADLALTMISTKGVDADMLTAVVFCFTFVVFCNSSTVPPEK